MRNKAFKLIILFFLPLLIICKAYGQSYKNAIGLRAGRYSGISYKQFLSSKNAFELYGLFRFYNERNLTSITGLYQIHNNIPNANYLKWYYGFGTLLGFNSYKDRFAGNRYQGVSIGILGNLGIELTLKEAPFCLALDWSPTFFLNHDRGFYGDYANFAVRYILGR
jgi:hypothetical protein